MKKLAFGFFPVLVFLTIDFSDDQKALEDPSQRRLNLTIEAQIK